MIAQENSGWADIVLLSSLDHALVLEQWRASAAQRAVCGDVNALFPAKVDNFLLGQQGVVLNLVDGGRDGGLGKQLLQVLDRVVSDANGFDLVRVRLDQLLEVLPGVDVCYGRINVARAVFVLGEEGMVS